MEIESLLKSACRGQPVELPTGEESISAQLFDEARHQGIASLLWHLHSDAGVLTEWPADLLDKLKQQARQEAATEMIREAEVQVMLEALQEKGIDLLLIKGTPLSALLYPAIGLRPRCDTDLLVAEGDDVRAAEVFKAHGYSSFFENAGDYLNSQRSFRRNDESGFTHAFDLHRQISNASITFSHRMGFHELNRRSVKVPSLGLAAKTLSHVDALLLACMHRAGHFAEMGERLIWLYDIHLLTEALSSAELDKLVERAGELEVRGLCADALNASNDWFATRIPTGLTDTLQQGAENEASFALLTPGRASRIRNTLLMDLQQISSWRERGRLLLQRLFPPADYMRWRYRVKHRWLLPFYYIYRLGQGVRLLFM
ncbi:nucleotidyltransferase domain-containing protein [Solemya velum gill symbiont]|uniref:Nucleotidyltransferase n=3 Tax=Solemya velum gill symbiont TaxID=2340 RepID=A0A1T2EW65_SOVGS|nr:nucleotidyltransferase family protein [Solemya velum gill symbiont]OOY35640.1 hypothetical protein BOV88_03065 [Solemya velum gill symbiont]OOY38268.1 hypothetical protein BOV89_02330 [Solemya velum gill symbiont]OOY39885.1 hypothetical protein BOV90_06985 [Solemya velum gill symbiont]OOY46973.1 hypothetical protein BOV92_02175 [Solemya velum gill symbiont]OOY52148.1 hypothetical protein BOV94_03660 [Solemya velum gill symbiont]